jgi:hypothetical protein
MAEVEIGLRGVVGRLAADPGRWILIIEVGPTPAMVAGMDCSTDECLRGYLQWLCCEDGSFVAEVSSSASLHPVHELRADQEARLAEFGWRSPDGPRQPNYWTVHLAPADAGESADLAVRTLYDVFDVTVEEPLLVKMVESSHRGWTPLIAKRAGD